MIKLPEPWVWDLYTPDQMRQAIRDAYEDAAKVCDELAELNRKAFSDSMWEQEECAAAIRKRKEDLK